MVVWLQLSYRRALPLKYWLAQCKVRPQYADYESKTKLRNVQVLLSSCQKDHGRGEMEMGDAMGLGM